MCTLVNIKYYAMFYLFNFSLDVIMYVKHVMSVVSLMFNKLGIKAGLSKNYVHNFFFGPSCTKHVHFLCSIVG